MGEHTSRTATGNAMRGAAAKLDRELTESREDAFKAVQTAGWKLDPSIREIVELASDGAHYAAWNNGYSTGAGAAYLESEQRAGIPIHNNGPHRPPDPRTGRLLREAALMRLLNSPAELLAALDAVHKLVVDPDRPLDRRDLVEILSDAGYPFDEDGSESAGPDPRSSRDAFSAALLENARAEADRAWAAHDEATDEIDRLNAKVRELRKAAKGLVALTGVPAKFQPAEIDALIAVAAYVDRDEYDPLLDEDEYTLVGRARELYESDATGGTNQ